MIFGGFWKTEAIFVFLWEKILEVFVIFSENSAERKDFFWLFLVGLWGLVVNC